MKKLLAWCLVLAMAFGVTACVPAETSSAAQSVASNSEASEPASAASTGTYDIVVMPKQVGITYFEAARSGVDKAGETLGVNAIFTGPTVADAAEQVSMIQDLISQGVDAIAVSANDAASLTPVLTQARESGIVILDWDSPAEESVVDLSIKEIDYEEFAHTTWNQLVEYMGTDEGDYVILTSTLTAGSCNAWIEYGLEYAKEKYPNLNLVCDPVVTNESVDEAYSKTLDLLTTYPDLKGIIGFSSPAPIGAGQAISEMGKQDAVALVGTCMPNDANTLMKEGAIDAGVLWNPADLGYVTVGLSKYVLDGNEISDGTVTLEGYGDVTIHGKEVILGAPLVFTADDVDNYNF